ncbi:GNAT family N-acetyltransferase [Paenibacillus marinisediminis]
MTEEDGRAICGWMYTPPYNLYQFLPWAEMKALEIEFGDPALRRQQYVVVRDEKGELSGFAQYFPMEGVTRLGLGMRPDLTGKGFGVWFVNAIVKEALRRNPNNEIDLEVLTWNKRAIAVYERCGFRITDTYERRTAAGMGTFHCMVYEGEGSFLT